MHTTHQTQRKGYKESRHEDLHLLRMLLRMTMVYNGFSWEQGIGPCYAATCVLCLHLSAMDADATTHQSTSGERENTAWLGRQKRWPQH